MRTIVLQCLVTLFFGVFGVASLLVARALTVTGQNRTAWFLTGVAFTVFAIDSATQNALGTTAYLLGAGAPVYAFYMKFAPVANHSRTFLVLAYCGALVWLLMRPAVEPRRSVWTAIGLMAAGLLVGGLVGQQEGWLVERTHYTRVALLDVVEMLVLLASLFVALVSERIDRLLWFALGTYAFSVALNIIWTIALAGVGIGWSPAPWQMHAYRATITFAMAAIAIRRLRLARRGVPVRGLLESRSPVRAVGSLP